MKKNMPSLYIYDPEYTISINQWLMRMVRERERVGRRRGKESSEEKGEKKKED